MRFIFSIILIFVFKNIYAISCSVSADNLNFGSYDISNVNPTLVDTNATATCDTAATVQVKLSTGNSGTYNDRKMYKSTDSIIYKLYTSNQYTTIWGDGNSGTSTVTFALTSDNNYTKQNKIYGEVPAQQLVPPGNYSDQITISFDY